MAWDYFREGSRVGNVRILDRLTSAENQERVVYAVACSACGAHHEMTHSYLLKRVRGDQRHCAACNPKGHGTPADVETDRHPEPEGSIRAGHLWWPLRGRFGRLHDTGNTQHRSSRASRGEQEW